MEITRTFESCDETTIVNVVQAGTDTHVLTVSVADSPGGGNVAVGGAGQAPPLPVPAGAGGATAMSWQVKPPAPGAITLHWTSDADPAESVEITYEYT
ncbi:MAG: hypothetical protein GF400_03205 [Candidatus Eisenbacteria bacterium]|nr:hypothetical protein [Candidatus Eisenbacteria bacterium]